MSEEIRKNVWARNNIPAFEFCTLPRAAELLNCQTNDLINFAQTGAIEICLELDGFEAALMMMRRGGDYSDWEEAYPPRMLSYINKSPISSFTPKAIFNFHFQENESPLPPKQLYHHEKNLSLRSPLVFLSGVWSIQPIGFSSSFFRKLKQNGETEITALDITFKEADIPFSMGDLGDDDYVILATPSLDELYPDGLLDRSKLKSIAKISIDDLYLTRQQIEKIDNCVGKEIPSYVNGGVEEPTPEARPSKIAEHHARNREGIFIAAIHVLAKYPEECRGEVKDINPDSWARAILNHGKEVPTLFSDSHQVIMRKLQAAVNKGEREQ